MKKLFLVLLACCFIWSQAMASPVNKTLIAETQLDDDPTSITGTYNVQDYEKVAFWVEYDETEVGNAISIAITFDFSYDNTNFVTGYFYDLAGGLTTQTTESLSSDGWYYCWLNSSIGNPMPRYVRMTITATNTDADDLAVVTAYMSGNK